MTQARQTTEENAVMNAAPAPFDLGNDDAYKRWRDAKLERHPKNAADLVVELRDPANPSPAEHQALLDRLKTANMALFVGGGDVMQGKTALRALGRRFGLVNLDPNMCADEDAITPLHVARPVEGQRQRYIPYTDKPIRWHTDGYYNELHKQIYGLMLFCECDSAVGGENQVLDHEIAYIRLRDENPDFIRALMHPEAMTIPENVVDGRELRPDRAGPVFMFHPTYKSLHMRYTMRARNVIWRDDATTKAAVEFLEATLNGSDPFSFKHRMDPGQGLISNNVLHDRAGFIDDATIGKTRMIYRARFFDRISGTALEEVWPHGQ